MEYDRSSEGNGREEHAGEQEDHDSYVDINHDNFQDMDHVNDVDSLNDEEEEYDLSDHDDDDSDQDDDNNGQPEPDDDPPLFNGAPITRGESLMCILTFAMRFTLTGVALSFLLKLIALHCPTPNFCKKSLFLFRKAFSSMHEPIRKKFYCSECYLKLNDGKSICQPCSQANPTFDKKAAYFIEVPLLRQLQTLYKRNDFYKLLRWRFQRVKKNENNYEDIYDGAVYQERSQPGHFLSNGNNISFTWNTDGVSLFKSSKFEIWPFYLSINELPYSKRTKKENLILAGLWFGPKKPLPSLFLNSICHELDQLKNGVEFDLPGDNRSRHVKAAVICGTCDLPAKAAFLNMKQFNGEYPCTKCRIRSEPLEPGSLNRIYPFQENLELRNTRQTTNYAYEAEIINDAVFGVKGKTIISRMTKDYIRQTAIDSMHAVFLGIVRALLIIWFDQKIGIFSNYRSYVDEKIRLITPPDFVPRLPRAIMDNLMYLKASELKAWFFYYSIPILKTFMPSHYLEHYMMLVKAIYLINQQSVSVEDLNLAEELIKDFVRQFSLMYGRENMTANLHQLLHLAQTVRDFGPIFTTSCFLFENANGILKNLVTGTKFADSQICTGLSVFMSLPTMKKTLLPDSPTAEFCEILTSQQRKYKAHKISVNSSVVGTMSKINHVTDIVIQALETFDMVDLNVRIFKQFMRSGILLTSELYERSRKTNSMYVKYKLEDRSCFGIVHCFLKISNCECYFCEENCDVQYYAVIKKLNTYLPSSTEPEIALPFIHRYRRSDRVLTIKVDDIECVCFCVEIKPQNIVYIVEPVNLIEME